MARLATAAGRAAGRDERVDQLARSIGLLYAP